MTKNECKKSTKHSRKPKLYFFNNKRWRLVEKILRVAKSNVKRVQTVLIRILNFSAVRVVGQLNGPSFVRQIIFGGKCLFFRSRGYDRCKFTFLFRGHFNISTSKSILPLRTCESIVYFIGSNSGNQSISFL